MELRNAQRLTDFIAGNKWKLLPLQLVILRNTNSDTWSPVEPTIDFWDDTAVLLKITGATATAEALFSVRATADPGKYYSKNPMNPRGTARLVAGQHFECWQRGRHFQQRAFTQCKPVLIQRDSNRNLYWSEETAKSENGIGINIHTTANAASNNLPPVIGRWSAGCVVIRSSKVFYNQLNPEFDKSGLKFLTVDIINGTDYASWRHKWG